MSDAPGAASPDASAGCPSGTLSTVTTKEQALGALGTDHLGGRLRVLRLERGFGLRELAGRLGISVSAVSQIERGTLQPSVNRLLAIVSALGVPLARVFDEPARGGAPGDGADRPRRPVTPRMEAWSAPGVAIALETVETAEGEQSAGSVELGSFGDGSFGVWTITEGVSTDVEADEVSVVLSGRGCVEDLDSGAVVEVTPGTVLRLAAGVRTRWTIVEPIRKVFVVH
jgi:transcriptional regulator with XRE-family HTH domain